MNIFCKIVKLNANYRTVKLSISISVNDSTRRTFPTVLKLSDVCFKTIGMQNETLPDGSPSS